ncbi:MAG: HAD-IA family hydrolase [Nitrospirae bacterium]|nr:HAD-IA family hydrolase [Nitrospirota bacterium]
MIKLIIFDLDGTLVDSSVDLTNALNYAIEPCGIEKLTAKQTKGLVGEGITKLIEDLLGPDRCDVHSLTLDRFMSYYSDHLVDFTVPYSGVVDTLKDLSSFRKAVVSNKRESLSKAVLGDLGLLRYFDLVLGSDSVGEKKPSPKPLMKVMEALSCRPSDTVIVGDSNFDIEAGRAAGTLTCAVTYGYRDARLLKNADMHIDCFHDLLGLLTAK